MGIETRDLTTWPQVKQVFDSLRERGFAFRGHACSSWRLTTTLQRLASVDPAQDEYSILRYFQRHGRPLLPSGVNLETAPRTTWLSLLQHYGGPTRLLDFTRSPYVAALFAFERPSDEPAAIWAVRPLALQSHARPPSPASGKCLTSSLPTW